MNYPRQLITVDRNFAQSSQVFSTPQIKSKSTKIPTDFTMEVSLTSVCCDFLSLSMSKAHFRARFFGVIWIKISDPRDGEWSFKNHRSRKLFAECPGLAVLLLCGYLRLAILYKTVSQSLKAKKFSKYQFVFFFL